MTTQEFRVRVHTEPGGGYWAEVEELPGCFASGRTMIELGDALGEAIGLVLNRPGGRFVWGEILEDEGDDIERRVLVCA